jgi:hypothetical protein
MNFQKSALPWQSRESETSPLKVAVFFIFPIPSQHHYSTLFSCLFLNCMYFAVFPMFERCNRNGEAIFRIFCSQ